MILTVPWNVSLKKVDVWFQDEAQFGQQTRPQGQEPLSNSSLNMFIFLVRFAQQQEIPKH